MTLAFPSVEEQLLALEPGFKMFSGKVGEKRAFFLCTRHSRFFRVFFLHALALFFGFLLAHAKA
jgi:hypothetical protein